MPTFVKVVVYNDPAHAWAKVNRTVIDELGIAYKITGYSYQRGTCVYLEEDCDLGVFIAAMKQRGYAVVLAHKHTNRRSRIRSYDSYCPTKHLQTVTG